MNDSEEWSYALKILEKVIREFDGIGSTSHLQDAFQTIRNDSTLHTHYTFSFSEESDLLSQWRGYCPNGGYSFSLNDEHLDQFVTAGFTLEACIYEEEAQREFILNNILKAWPEQRRSAFEDEKKRRAEGRFGKGGADFELYGIANNNLIRNSHLLALLKHPSFREEREWRLVASYSRPNTLDNQFGFRVSRNMIVPYLTVKIPLLSTRVYSRDRKSYSDPTEPTLRLSEIVVGPTVHQDLALAACRTMMISYQEVSVKSSEIPYINW